MQFTPQQLVGAGRYSATTRIGNWNEDLMLEEARMKDYRAQKQKGGLGTVYRRKMEQANGRVPVSYWDDGFLRYNSYVVVEHVQTSGSLASDVWEETFTGSGEYVVSVGQRPPHATARTTFLLVGPSERSSGIVKYGDSFRLMANEALRVDLTTNSLLPPLYLRSTLKSERAMSPISSHQNVTLSPVTDNSTLWVATKGDASGAEKFLATSTPISTHDNVGLVHKMTGILLHADAKYVIATDFGNETEVCCATMKNHSKSFNLHHERQGDRSADMHAKETQSPNLWRLALGSSPGAAEESRALPAPATPAIVLDLIVDALTCTSVFHVRALVHSLQAIDAKTTGLMEREDLKWAIKALESSSGKAALRDDQYDVLLSALDEGKKGFIRLTAFIDAIRGGSLSPSRMALVHDTYDGLTGAYGDVTLNVLRQAYDKCCEKPFQTIKSKPVNFLTLWTTQDPARLVSLHEFVDVYKDVSRAIADDSMFDQLLKNAWGEMKKDPMLLEMFAVERIQNCARGLMSDTDTSVRTAALRVLRYSMINCASTAQAIKLVLIRAFPILLIRDAKLVGERIQALKVVRRLMDIDASQVPTSVVRSVVAIANHKEDNLRRVALETLRELAIANVSVVMQCNGIKTLVDCILDPTCQGILIMTANPQGLRSLVRMLEQPVGDDVKKVVLATICDIFYTHAPLDKNGNDVDRSGDSIKGASSSAKQHAAAVLSTHAQTNLLDNYMVMVLLSLGHCGLLQALVALAIELLSEILHLSARLLPDQHCAMLLALPQLVATTAYSQVDYLADLQTKPPEDRLQRERAIRSSEMLAELAHANPIGVSFNLAAIPEPVLGITMTNDTINATHFFGIPTRRGNLEFLNVSGVPNLNTIGLSALGLRSIPKFIFKLPKLTRLFVRHNNFTLISLSLAEYQFLTKPGMDLHIHTFPKTPGRDYGDWSGESLPNCPESPVISIVYNSSNGENWSVCVDAIVLAWTVLSGMAVAVVYLVVMKVVRRHRHRHRGLFDSDAATSSVTVAPPSLFHWTTFRDLVTPAKPATTTTTSATTIISSSAYPAIESDVTNDTVSTELDGWLLRQQCLLRPHMLEWTEVECKLRLYHSKQDGIWTDSTSATDVMEVWKGSYRAQLVLVKRVSGSELSLRVFARQVERLVRFQHPRITALVGVTWQPHSLALVCADDELVVDLKQCIPHIPTAEVQGQVASHIAAGL
ncbi:hypothetical protein DYB30_003399, partial [Aphanomyces astaci]